MREGGGVSNDDDVIYGRLKIRRRLKKACSKLKTCHEVEGNQEI